MAQEHWNSLVSIPSCKQEESKIGLEIDIFSRPEDIDIASHVLGICPAVKDEQLLAVDIKVNHYLHC